MRIYQVETEQEMPKCGGCNWESSNLYALANSEEEAQELYETEQAGCCSQCLVELLANYGIVPIEEAQRRAAETGVVNPTDDDLDLSEHFRVPEHSQ
jgi:hypothetical protein